jgi:hypothetical protein
MAQMRRSAGLPFIAISLMKSSDGDEVLHGLIGLGKFTDNLLEATNVMNPMRSAVQEQKLPIHCLSRIFALFFRFCRRFPSCWDVLSAVDLALVLFLNKIWEMLGGETILLP